MVAFTIGTLSVFVAATGAGSDRGGVLGGGLAQAASNPRIAAGSTALQRVRTFDMWILILEALGAALLLGLIVWWTMFHGRSKGERGRDSDGDI
ncbi:MAG: hypothetical protein V4750_04740 [Pseudomonadota bacterium]